MSKRNILTCSAILALAFVLAFARIDDYDVWWHLKCGELIVKDHWFPTKDIFSYTANGVRWVDGYIPAQVFLYLIWHGWGAAGICTVGALMVTAIFGTALAISRRKPVGLAVAMAVAIPAIFMARGTMIPRPALLSPLFALFTLWLLENHRLRGGGRQIWWLLPLTVLWANCHPGFLMGPIFTIIYIAGYQLYIFIQLLQKRRKKAVVDPTPYPKLRNGLLLALAGQLAATFVNPYGHKIYFSAFSLAATPQLTKQIVEWKPLYTTPSIPAGTIMCLIVICAIWLAAICWAGRKTRIEHAGLFIFLILGAIYSRRNLIYFAPISIPLISWTIAEAAGQRGFQLSQRLRAMRSRLAGIGETLILLTALFFVWFTATDRLYFYSHVFRSTGTGVQLAMFPERAVELLKKEKVVGNIYHPYHLGGYLIFRLFPQYRVFIDGRIYPYPYELFDMEEKALGSSELFSYLQTRYDIRAVLLPLYPHSLWPSMHAFMRSRNWATVQADGSGVLFIGRGAGNDDIIRRYEINLLKEPPVLDSKPPGREFHWWNKTEYPYGQIEWGKFYEQIDRKDLAAKVMKSAMNYRPLVKNADAWLGGLLVQSGSLDEGLEIIQKVLKSEPENIAALTGLADYYIAKKDNDKAEELLFRALRWDPTISKAWETLGQISYNRHDFGAAVNRFRRALTFEPKDYKLWEELGMSLQYFDRDGARDAFNRSIRILRATGGEDKDIKRVEESLKGLGK